ncbi:PREDICTED: F-box/LRR-repeat protein 4-like isoform X2 [Vollenhovia emeryi]|uniref:F-box/LRR-repeat protein 4-like isoform X2 n=1 Tax=Vollenhovia emeryi TaxID=411798 RepID=UPI0005F4DD17|nr:PREDICTED: F-box/LRR-repeat protein 4-like isoform X2 [Vollenhovia emeryi]
MYDPGYIIQILAQDSQDNRWIALWTSQFQYAHSRRTGTFYTPPQSFKTKKLRIKFLHSLWEYFSCLDSVMLIGTSKLIRPHNSKQSVFEVLSEIYQTSCHGHCRARERFEDIKYLHKHFSEYCTIDKRNLHSDYAEIIKDIRYLFLDESEGQPRCSFSTLPDKIILNIFQSLDIKSLCRMSTMDKRLNNLTRDASLFKCFNVLNMRNMNAMYIDNILSYCTSRCRHIQQLDFTSSDISISKFREFLQTCGGRLTHLRLRNCKFVGSYALFTIAEVCNNLKEFLEELNLNGTHIIPEALCPILRRNRRMRDLRLNRFPIDNPFIIFALCPSVNRVNKIYVDSIIIELRNSCPDLEILDISGGTITDRGIDALAECKNLRTLGIWNRMLKWDG